MASLDELGLHVVDVDLGGFDAESDYKLAEDFVQTGATKTALAGRRHLMLGRKGSGKSSLFTQLPSLARDANGPEVVDITPDDYAWNALRGYREQGLPNEQAHTNAWKFTLAVEAIQHLVNVDWSWSRNALQSLSVLKDFVAKNFGKQQTKGLLPATSLVKGVESLNLSAFGFGVRITNRDVQEQRITPQLIDILLDHLKAPFAEFPLILELDRLDDAWDGTDESQSLLTGLLKASKDLNDRFRLLAPQATRVLVFLRTDIYDGLTFDDKDKHRSFEENLNWSESEIRDLVGRRLPGGVSVDALFEAGEMRGRTAPFEYLLRRTFLQPREVLQFVHLCLDQAGSQARLVRKDDVTAAEEVFSTWKVDDLKQEFSKVLPHFGSLLEALRQQVHRYDDYEELIEVLENNAPEAVTDVGPRGAMEILFETSVIGIRLSGAGQTRFKSTSPNLTLPATGSVYVHQGLVKGLNITETRKPSTTDD